jgi:hypothetical protein
MIMRCGRQGWSPRRPNLICHNPSVTAIVSRVRVLLAHQGMSLPDALAPADVRLPVWVKMRRTRIEHMSAGLSPITDIAQRGWHGREVPCVDGSELTRTFFTFAALVGAAMCSAFRCGSHGRWP